MGEDEEKPKRTKKKADDYTELEFELGELEFEAKGKSKVVERMFYTLLEKLETGKLKAITAAVKELEEKGAALYKEMSSLAIPKGTLAALRDMVRELDKARLEVEILESDYQTLVNTIKSLQEMSPVPV